MRYLKISKNYYIEGNNTLKKGNPIYPFVNLNVDNNGNKIGVFTDKLIIREDTQDVFEQFIIQYLRDKNSSGGSQISTNYVTRKQLYRIKGIQHLENFNLQDLNITELNFAKYFKNLLNFVFPKGDGDYTNTNFILHKPPTNVISLCTNNYNDHNRRKDHYKKNDNHHVKLNYSNKSCEIKCKITYLNNINKYYNHNDRLPANFLCGLQNENLDIKVGIIEEFQNSENYTNTINNLNIECSSMKSLAFYKSAIQNVQLKFDDNSKGIIRNSAFYGSKIQKASFYNVQRIEFGAFSHCNMLNEIHIHSQKPVWLESYCFYDCYSLTDIYFDYTPKIAYGKGLPYKNGELIYPNVCVHGRYSGKSYRDSKKLIDISDYCYFIFKMFCGTYRTNGHLNIHIKNKENSLLYQDLYRDFTWKINEYNKQKFIDHDDRGLDSDRYCTINII